MARKEAKEAHKFAFIMSFTAETATALTRKSLAIEHKSKQSILVTSLN